MLALFSYDFIDVCFLGQMLNCHSFFDLVQPLFCSVLIFIFLYFVFMLWLLLISMLISIEMFTVLMFSCWKNVYMEAWEIGSNLSSWYSPNFVILCQFLCPPYLWDACLLSRHTLGDVAVMVEEQGGERAERFVAAELLPIVPMYLDW